MITRITIETTSGPIEVTPIPDSTKVNVTTRTKSGRPRVVKKDIEDVMVDIVAQYMEERQG